MWEEPFFRGSIYKTRKWYQARLKSWEKLKNQMSSPIPCGINSRYKKYQPCAIFFTCKDSLKMGTKMQILPSCFYLPFFGTKVSSDMRRCQNFITKCLNIPPKWWVNHECVSESYRFYSSVWPGQSATYQDDQWISQWARAASELSAKTNNQPITRDF